MCVNVILFIPFDYFFYAYVWYYSGSLLIVDRYSKSTWFITVSNLAMKGFTILF